MSLDLKQSWPKLLLATVVVVVPALLGYMKTHEETAAQIQLANKQADAGYQTLVDSVKHLESVVEQHSVSLQLLTRELIENTAIKYIPAPPLPDFAALPADSAAALRQVQATE